MMTDKGREIFAHLLDLNHDCNILRGQLAMKEEQYEEIKELLIEEMGGQDKYDEFFRMVRELFAPIED